jgi:short chain dehydrogenase
MMKKPSSPEGTTTKTSSSSSSWIISLLGMIGLLFVIASPLLISEAIGGWTRQYTSYPVYFTPSRSIPNLTGQVALVTGANTGIGFETALELARHGAHVIVAARSAQKGQAAIERITKEFTTESVPSSIFSSSTCRRWLPLRSRPRNF